MKNTPKALFLDIDGTLIGRDTGPFTQDIAQIQEARKQGHRIFLNTGRSWANIPRVFLHAPYVDGMITGSGAHVLLNGKTIYHTWIPEETLTLVCDLYTNNQKWCVFEGETDIYGINRYDPRFFIKEIFTVKEKNDFLTLYKGARITKLTVERISTDEETMVLQEHFKLNLFPDYAEAIIKGASKAQGMEIMLSAVGIPREHSIAIGDSVNDLDMLSYAGLGIAMGNACEDLKHIAQEITLDCEHGGVGYAIRQWVLG